MKYLRALWEFCSYLFVPQRRPKSQIRNNESLEPLVGS